MGTSHELRDEAKDLIKQAYDLLVEALDDGISQ